MKYIKGFDALRALSIAFVMLNHVGLDGAMPKDSFARIHLWPLFSGETGVHIFFVLSGFLITAILLNEKVRTGKINLRYFYIRRFLRLLPPLVLLFATVAILMGVGLLRADWLALLMSFFYLYNYVPLLHYVNELAHTWSLAVEEQFYLLWPVLVLLAKKYNAMLLVCGICIVASVVAIFTFPEYAFPVHLRPKRWFIPAAGYIFVGCLFAILKARFASFQSAVSRNGAAFFSLALILFAAPAYVPVSLIETSSIVQAFGIGFLLLWIEGRQHHWLVRFMDFAPFVYIGKISYGLYVYQGLFLTTGVGSKLAFQQFPLNVALTFAAAILSYHLVEKPVLKFKERFQVASTLENEKP